VFTTRDHGIENKKCAEKKANWISITLNFRVAARYMPMTSVAGDFYDYIIADDHQVGLLIADVSGHGVPAALIVSMVKLAAASQRAVAADPCRFLSGMNSALLGNTQNLFVTAAYVGRIAILGSSAPASVACAEWTCHPN